MGEWKAYKATCKACAWRIGSTGVCIKEGNIVSGDGLPCEYYRVKAKADHSGRAPDPDTLSQPTAENHGVPSESEINPHP